MRDAEETTQADSAARTGNKILLVEDNAFNSELGTAMIDLLGYRVEAVDSGKRAIEKLRQTGDFELVLMDCQMPEMDGFEATRFIRDLQKKGEIAAMPIVALTANTMKGDRERCFEAGMDDYLAKPLCKQTLKAILQKWLAKDKSQPALINDVVEEKNSPAIPYLDWEALGEVRTLMGGKFDNALQLFFEDTDTRIAAIEKLLAAHGAMKDIVLQAHSLKSSSAHMGAARLADSAGKMEMHVQEVMDQHREGANVPSLLREMRAIYAETRQNFRSLK